MTDQAPAAPVKRPYYRRTYKKAAVRSQPQQIAAYTAKKQYTSIFEDLTTDADALVDQVLNPEDVNDICRWPNTMGLSSVYKCKTVFNAKFDPSGRSCVSVSPTIKNSILATAGEESEYRIWPFNDPPSQAPYSFQNLVLDESQQTIQHSAPIIFGGSKALLPVPNAGLKKLVYPIAWRFGSTLSQKIYLRLRFPNALTNQAGVRVTAYNSTFQVIFGMSHFVEYKSGDASGYGCDFELANTDTTPGENVSYLSIEIVGQSLPYRGPVFSWFNTEEASPPTFIILPNHAQHVGIYDIKDAAQIQNSTNQSFVLSQSLLLTSEMSDINNGGMLAIGRVPGNSPIGMDSTYSNESIASNNWYEWVSSLANNNYDGPVKDGGYAFYLPEDEQGYFYRSTDNFFSAPLPYLVSEFTVNAGLEDAAIVRIKISTIVQFTTTASIYDQRPSCHVPDIALVHHILSLVNAAYSNDGHKEGLKRALKAMGHKVKKMLRDPKTYATAAKLLAGLGTLVI